MSINTSFVKHHQYKMAESYQILARKSRNLGQIMKNNPKYQSNSPELYLLAYLTELGLAKS
jgi:hypothetical protein